MPNLTARLSTRKMPHKDVPICLDLDLLVQREDAMKKVADARKREAANEQNERLASPASKATLTKAIADLEAIEQSIRDASITLRIYGVDRHTYNDLVLANPPRKGRQEPFNSETFFMHAARESGKYVDETGAEHDISGEEWDAIDKALTDGEYDRVASAVVHVNRSVGGVDVGFFGNVSGVTRDSSETSESRGTSGSRPGGSGAGSRPKSTKSKSTKKGDASSE